MEVQTTEYNFLSLESHLVSLVKRKILSNFNLVNEKEIVHILKMFKNQTDHLSAIELKTKYTFPIFTQRGMLLEAEL